MQMKVIEGGDRGPMVKWFDVYLRKGASSQ
jgi:hypothetical protein